MTDDFPWHLLDRYFGGECTPSEAERVRKWIGSDPERARQIEWARVLWSRSGALSPRFDARKGWQRIREQMPRSWSPPEPAKPPVIRLHPPAAAQGRRFASRAALLRIAASLVVVLVSAALYRLHSGSSGNGPEALYVTGTGEQSRVRLADGTLLVLSAATRVRVPESYGKGRRSVYLDSGEAFFQVKHDARRPFLVFAAGAIAEDLGTEFLVRTEGRGAGARVVVAEGEVELRSRAGGGRTWVTLSPGQLGRVDGSGSITVDSSVNVSAHTGWVGGKLAFDEAPLLQVLADLERWYGVSFRVTDAGLAGASVTATLGDRPVDEVLAILAAVLDAHYHREGSVVTLSPAP